MATQKEMTNQETSNRIPSGYEGSNIPTDFTIPSVGIKDVDKAMFDLFDKDNPIYIKTRNDDSNEQHQKKTPVIFAVGERFVLRERDEPIRDRSGALILPLISIKRTGINQAKENMGSAIGQDTGNFIIKKRLSEKDPLYQNIINKQGLKNQDNVSAINNYLNSSTSTGNKPGTVASRRPKSENFKTSKSNKSIYDIISIPFPIRYTVSYEVVFWTSFQTHMNQMLERVMTNYDGQGRTYKINTTKGYWFIAYFEDDIESQDNSEEFTDEERIHRYSFKVNVPAFMLANKNGGDMIPIRRYISAPQVSFEFIDGIFTQKPDQGTAGSGNPDDFILDNLDNLDGRGNPIRRLPDYFEKQIIKDPFSGKDEEAFVRIKRRDARSGEKTISSRRLLKVEIP